MDRAEAIKDLQENGIDLGAGDFVDVEALKVAVAAMQELEQRKWISVEDRLPEEDKRVLVWLADGGGTYTQMDTDRIHLSRWARWGRYVTHWMPLPEPPKV